MDEYRWDLHYLRLCNRGTPRCTAVDDHGIRPGRCEYVQHAGRIHGALDGGLMWEAIEYHPDRDPYCVGCGGTGWAHGSPCPCTMHLHGPDGCTDICAERCPTRLASGDYQDFSPIPDWLIL